MKRKSRGNGEGTVYRAAGDRPRPWCAVVTVGWTADGRPVRRARFAASRTQALTLLRELRHARDIGLRGGNATVTEYLARWVADADLRPRTRDNYERGCRMYWAPLLGARRLSELTPVDIRAALATIPRAAKTRANILGILRAALAQAVRDGILERNPAALVAAPRGEPKPRGALNVEQVRRLLEATRHDRLYALFLLAATTGMRQGELLGLTWSDIEGNRVHVRRALARIDGEYVGVPVKTTAGLRDIVLGPSALAALDAHRARQAAEAAAAGLYNPHTRRGWRDRGLLFCRPDGEPLNSRVVTLAFQSHLAAAGLPKATFHDLRHFAATAMVAESGDLKMAQVVLGHSNIGVTADVYAHAVEAQLQRAATLMEGVVSATADSTAD